MGVFELEVGAELPGESFVVTRADLVRYAGASGDFNPIHYSDRVATAVGLPGVIAHGMLTMALGATAIKMMLGDETEIIEYSVRFSKPVIVPDDDSGTEVSFEAIVAEVEDDGTARLDISAQSYGQKVLTLARARVRPPKA